MSNSITTTGAREAATSGATSAGDIRPPMPTALEHVPTPAWAESAYDWAWNLDTRWARHVSKTFPSGIELVRGQDWNAGTVTDGSASIYLPNIDPIDGTSDARLAAAARAMAADLIAAAVLLEGGAA